MAKASRAGVSSATMLMVALGFFFVVLGITGIIPQAGEGIFGLSRDRTTMEIVFGVIELACGAFLLYDAMARIPSRTSTTVLVIILILWLARIVWTQFFMNLDTNSKGLVFQPGFWAWLLTMATDLVIAAGLWVTYKNE